ncbi:hypothetical protein DFJ73DRAFT_835397 [Zopfochytrium polystomum]|nr:hypothetical protein DFJ73DRAFT_835397 [Zopfochytrium polystomum]
MSELSGNQSLAGSLLIFVVVSAVISPSRNRGFHHWHNLLNAHLKTTLLAQVTCYREQWSRIDDSHLAVSLSTAMVATLFACASNAVIDRAFWSAPVGMGWIRGGESYFLLFYDGFVSSQRTDKVGFVIAFASIIYHTAHRCMAIFLPHRKDLPGVVAGLIALVQFALHIADLSVNLSNYSTQFQSDDGTATSPIAATSVVLAAYAPFVAAVFFIASQMRVIAALRETKEVVVGVAHYADAVMRCACFIGSALLFFGTAGGIFFPPEDGSPFMYVTPSVMCVVLLTDSDRVRRVLSKMRTGQSSFISTKEMSGSGAASSKERSNHC